jgi:hypothetical protein
MPEATWASRIRQHELGRPVGHIQEGVDARWYLEVLLCSADRGFPKSVHEFEQGASLSI